ncbi:MAG: ABC-ATPase domain-containing protein [Lachnospiraceae bacterium]|nr:ABC-ATPase domain-containing protein [Lachnospiraceae bacterium]
MNTRDDLKRQLAQIDHKGYKAYKVLEGVYEFGAYRLAIDHVQGDPFATPSRVRLLYQNGNNIPQEYFCTRARKTAAEDFLLRRLHRSLRAASGDGRKGSGKSGLITACRVGQEVLERTAVLLSQETIEVRIEVGFPAYGRTIAAKELEEILFTVLPAAAKQAFAICPDLERGLAKAVYLADDQEYIRGELEKRDLVSFVADGSVLPRESGISQRPMKDAVPFHSPESLAVTLDLPHRGRLRGMGIRRGVTVVVGGGYHGKSTLLKAIERGVYNHIAGDGREYVITDSTAFKLRAEEGRCIRQEDISMFISHLPSRADTVRFSTENASGSTSQAANTIEALACGSRVLLIDEDTSATNFMVRDERMAQLVADEKEPITPFIRRVRSLYEQQGVSTVLVVGSSGAYLSVADTVIQMDCYEARDVTEKAAKLISGEMIKEGKGVGKVVSAFARGDAAAADGRLGYGVRRQRIEKMRVHGWDTLSLDRTEIDLRYLEQIVDETQTASLGYLLQYILEHLADGRKNAAVLAREASEKLQKDGLISMIPKNYGAGAPAYVREQEILAGLARYRG